MYTRVRSEKGRGKAAPKKRARKNTLPACARPPRGERGAFARASEDVAARDVGAARENARVEGEGRCLAACCHLHESARLTARGWPFARNKTCPPPSRVHYEGLGQLRPSVQRMDGHPPERVDVTYGRGSEREGSLHGDAACRSIDTSLAV